MKIIYSLLLGLSTVFSGLAQYSEYQPAPDNGLSRTEIRRLLLKQEKETPVWKLAKQSRTSNTVGVALLSVGSVFAIAGMMGLVMDDVPAEQSYLFPWAAGALGFGVINMGFGIWQLNRSGRKLDQAIKLYYGD